MQGALVDAAIELLLERGWAATTSVAVCERVGCTRGALMHHYASLSALLARALESLHEDFMSTARPAPTTMASCLEAVWCAVGDPRFKAVLEAWFAAGNDPELARELRPAVARFAKLVSPDGVERDSPLRDADGKAFFLMAREAMLGLAVGRATNAGKPLGHERAVLRRLRTEADAFDNHAEMQ